MKILLLIIFMICGITTTNFAQSKGEDDFPDPEVMSNNILKDYNKLSDLDNKDEEPIKPKHYGPYKSRGYKIIIYSGHDKNEAEKIKNEFLAYFPKEDANVIFETPTYKVKVGNYSSNVIARKSQRKLLEYFHFAMVIPSTIIVTPKN